ncbi:MAG: hypothetical protein NW208_05260 [Bryobacter sp.]|nr:hypothetical protein [Bryobacter sp.]
MDSLPWRFAQRKPKTVNAQVNPLAAAQAFPNAGFGASAVVVSPAKNTNTIPQVIAPSNSHSRRLTFSFNNHGPRLTK